MRINKYLVVSGLAESRRKADEIIRSGRVSINDEQVKDLSYQVKEGDIVKLDGAVGEIKSNIYIAYHKPRGEICSHKRYGNDKTIFDSLPKSFSQLKIAGRLDRDSEGLVILSSDGNFVNDISHPSKNKTKAYMVTTKESLNDEDIDKLNTGIKLEDGISKLKVTRSGDNIIKVVMNEGRNRQIRRTLEAINKDVVKLVRIRIGKFTIRGIMPNKFEFIKPEDVL